MLTISSSPANHQVNAILALVKLNTISINTEMLMCFGAVSLSHIIPSVLSRRSFLEDQTRPGGETGLEQKNKISDEEAWTITGP